MCNSRITALVGSMQKFSTEDGPGIRTTVFLKGCPLRCKWCHNPEMIDFEQGIIRLPNSCIKCGYCMHECPRGAIFLDDEGKVDIRREDCDLCMRCTETCYAKALQPIAKEMTPEEVMRAVAQDKGFYDHTGGGMTISGGEMLAQPDFCDALIDLAEAEGIGVCLDTSGCGDGARLLAMARRANVTNVLFDLKAIDDDVHVEYTGLSNALILENLALLAGDADVLPKVVMRMPLIKGVNDTEPLIDGAARFFAEHGIGRVCLLPYHTLGVSKARNVGREVATFEPPSGERLAEIRARFEGVGMVVEVLGDADR